MTKSKFKKGQKVVCVHYKDKPVVTVEEVYKGEIWANVEVWVKDSKGKSWWGPTNWFKKVGK